MDAVPYARAQHGGCNVDDGIHRSRRERLGDQRAVTLILRLTVDHEGRVLGGAVGYTDADRWIRFRGLDGLDAAVIGALEGPGKERHQ
jgi:hypothetical protein